MRFIAIIKERADAKAGAPPEEVLQAIGEMAKEAASQGMPIEMAGLQPLDEAVRVRLAGGSLSRTDGPFAEAREVIGGYLAFAAPTKEQAVDWVTRFLDLHRLYWPAIEAEIELRQITPEE